MSFEPPDPLKLFESIRRIIDAIVSFVRANQWSNLLILIGTLLALILIIDRVLFDKLITASLPKDYPIVFLVIELLIFITAIALKLFNLDRPLSPRLRRILLLLMSGTVLIYLIAGLIFQHLIAGLIFQPSTTQFKCSDGNEYCFSWGERVLISEDSLEATRKESCMNNFNLKKNGTQSYGKNTEEGFDEAEAQFRQYIDKQKCPNDPEAHIYLNNAKYLKNAKAQMSEKNLVRVAVSVPISRSNSKGVSEAQETLRGIALAQYKVNDKKVNGIDGKKLIVGIADDGFNNAKEVAKFLVGRPPILGVIGHSTSTTTKDARPIYQEEGVVAISPSSTFVSSDRSSDNDYVFRTASNDSIAVKQLVKYISNHTKIKKIAIVHDNDIYSESYKKMFEKEFKFLGNGSEVINESNTGCDLSNDNFDDDECLEKVGKQAEALLLAPSSPRAKNELVLSILRKATIPLFGADSMYNLEVAKALNDANKRIIVAVPWHRNNPWLPLQQDAYIYFGQHAINWNTAMAYDATLTLAEGLQKASKTCSFWDKKLENHFNTDKCLRIELKNVLSKPDFFVVEESAVEGGVIQFDAFGDRCAEETDKEAKEGGYCGQTNNKIGVLVEAKNGNFFRIDLPNKKL
ncbi:ABC transporter substrate-binding protein [Chroococcidiopsis thermalis]|uniref:Extracellular ligand-binding receptor n=1 Tax=Chroococcidiopsis thermalis (strain PCC 7203) TaxID=251229 RepID=K9TVP2_CHRTP|nr:ABC transporter substrate-binding protein [Chroococcidiopsis thermalis]AFY86892.1 Extracellular ligand-binding receptor [Chroococcidiopsis thermalis PCC 7203]